MPLAVGLQVGTIVWSPLPTEGLSVLAPGSQAGITRSDIFVIYELKSSSNRNL